MPERPRDLVDTILCLNTVAYIFTIVIGVIGNLWVAWKVGVVLLFDSSSSVPRQILYCIFVICCADLIVLCDLSLLVHFQITEEWAFGKTTCKIFYCVEVLNKFVIPLTLVQISRASYKSVRLCRKTKRANGQACLVATNAIAAGTVIMLLACVAYFSDTNTYQVRKKSMTVCNFNPPHSYQTVFNFVAFVVGYLMTSASYVYFYVNVPILLQRRYSSSVNGQSSNRINDHSIVRIRRTITAFVVVYLACWTPYWVLFWFLSMVHIVERWMVVVSTFTHLLPYVSCTAYPVILTAMNKGIRSAHSSIMDNKRRQFSTIRNGAMQAMTAHMGMIHTWMRVDTSPKTDTVLELSKPEEDDPAVSL